MRRYNISGRIDSYGDEIPVIKETSPDGRWVRYVQVKDKLITDKHRKAVELMDRISEDCDTNECVKDLIEHLMKDVDEWNEVNES